MKTWLLLFTLLVLGLATPRTALQAEEPHVINAYTARLSTKDHYNPQGERLKSPADIIRMDRVNFHKLHNPDSEDEGDNFYDTDEHRQLLDEIIKHSHISGEAAKEIVDGTPLVHVTTYRESNGNIWLDVKILHH
jgi:hypothetical protein